MKMFSYFSLCVYEKSIFQIKSKKSKNRLTFDQKSYSYCVPINISRVYLRPVSWGYLLAMDGDPKYLKSESL